MSSIFCFKNQLVRRGVHLLQDTYLDTWALIQLRDWCISIEPESIPFSAMQAETDVNTE